MNHIKNVVIFTPSFQLYKSFIVGKNNIKVTIHQIEYKNVSIYIESKFIIIYFNFFI